MQRDCAKAALPFVTGAGLSLKPLDDGCPRPRPADATTGRLLIVRFRTAVGHKPMQHLVMLAFEEKYLVANTPLNIFKCKQKEALFSIAERSHVAKLRRLLLLVLLLLLLLFLLLL